MKTEDLKSIGEVLPQIPQTPLRAYDWELVGNDYAKQALAREASARFFRECPVEYQNTDFSDERLAPYKQQAGKILGWKIGKVGLLAAGPTGRGKTRAMWALIRRLSVEEKREVRAYHSSQWFAKLAECMNFGRDDASSWVETVARRPLVFIDDIGQEAIRRRDEDWAAGWFLRFLDIRISLGLPLLATTNLAAVEIANGADQVRAEPLLRRLLECTEAVKF